MSVFLMASTEGVLTDYHDVLQSADAAFQPGVVPVHYSLTL
jgi:hypothetical protein